MPFLHCADLLRLHHLQSVLHDVRRKVESVGVVRTDHLEAIHAVEDGQRLGLVFLVALLIGRALPAVAFGLGFCELGDRRLGDVEVQRNAPNRRV